MKDIFNREISPGDLIAVNLSYIPLIGLLENSTLTVAVFVQENDTIRPGITIVIPVIPIEGKIKKLQLIRMIFSGECVKIDDITKLNNWQTAVISGTTNMLMYFSEKIREGHSPDEIHITTEYNSD